MIRGLLILVMGFGAVLVGIPFSASASSGLSHSVHDFSGSDDLFEPVESASFSWDGARKGKACRACHVPFDLNDVAYGSHGIAWNSRTTTKTRWQLYTDAISVADQSMQGAGVTPLGVSKLCLGCHDGVVAGNQYDRETEFHSRYGRRLSKVKKFVPRSEMGRIGLEMMQNHPISVAYDEMRNLQLRGRTSGWMANGKTIKSLLINGRVECSTCHDVHNRESVDDPLLLSGRKGADRTGIGASDLCFTCHNK